MKYFFRLCVFWCMLALYAGSCRGVDKPGEPELSFGADKNLLLSPEAKELIQPLNSPGNRISSKLRNGLNNLPDFKFNVRRRELSGDFTNVNLVLQGLVLPLSLTIQPKQVIFEAFIFVITLEAIIGDKGECRNLKVMPLGDVVVTGTRLAGLHKVNGINYQAHEIKINLHDVQFECDIPLKVLIQTISGIPADGLNTGPRNGNLNFISQTAAVTQTILAYSKDYNTLAPEVATPGTCVADPGALTYTGTGLAAVAGFDITSTVIGEIESDPSLVEDDIRTELCGIANELASNLSSVLVQNFLVNTSSEFYIADPFNRPEGDSTVPPALQLEADIYEQGLNNTNNLFDLTDRDNFFVKILLPGEAGPGEEPIINTILGLFVNQNDTDINGYDPLLLFLSENLGLNFSENGGKIRNLDLISIFNGGLFTEDPSTNPDQAPDLDVNVNFNFSTGSLFINVTAVLDELFLDIDPPEDGPVLPNLIAIGKQTLKVPGLDLNNIKLHGNIQLFIDINNTGDEENLFLKTPFAFSILDSFDVSLEWDGFVAQIALLFALDVDDLLELNFGPLLDNIFDCIISSFLYTPRLTGVTVDEDEVRISIGNFSDALLVLVGDIISVLIPVYQPVIPRGLELLAQENLANQEIITPTVCPKANISLDSWEIYPYNFSQGIFFDISEIADENLLNDILEFAEFDDNGINLIGNTDNSDGNEGNGEISFQAALPAFQGWQQNLDFKITNVRIEGLLPPTIHDFEVLKVIQESIYSPQELHNLLDIGSAANPLKLKAKLYMYTTEPIQVSEIATEFPPLQMYPQENDVNFEMTFDHARLLLDFYFKYSQFDVDSQEIGNIIDINCWLERLNPFGGITQLSLLLETMKINVNCDCNNRFLEEITELLNDPEIWPEIYEFVTDLVDRIANLLINLFKPEEKWYETIEDAHTSCFFGNVEDTNTSTAIVELHEDFEPLIVYLALFGTALFIPCAVGFCFRHFGPKLKKEYKLDDSEDGLHLKRGMWSNPLIPFYIRLFMPLMLITNIILFIVGDTGAAVAINVYGHIVDVPIRLENFQTLSVITSVRALWDAKAYLLAGLLFIFSIAWPYVKMFMLSLCWFIPPKFLTIKRRTLLVTWLDIFGRFSFAEFDFLVFVLVVFQLKGGAPNTAFLPQEDIFSFELDIEPLISLFTFAFAVVVSILLSNVMLVLSRGIEKENRIQIRKIRLEAIERAKKIQGLTTFSIDEDKLRFRLTNWDFLVNEVNVKTGEKYNYSYSITTFATITIATFVLATAVILILACYEDTLHIEIHGFVGLLIEFADEDSKYDLSVFELLAKVIENYKSSAIIYFVAVVFILTIVIIPILQTFLLFSLLFKRYSVGEARKIIEVHHIASVWCCVDIFVIAITLTVLELPTVGAGLVSAIEECVFIGEFMQDVLEPLGYVDEVEADASCMALYSSINVGGYIAILAVLVLSLSNFFVSKLFHHYLETREHVVEVNEHLATVTGNNGDSLGLIKTEYKAYHKLLYKLNFIKFESQATRAWRRLNDATKASAVIAVTNPLFDENELEAKILKDPTTKEMVRGNALGATHMLPTNKKLQVAREEEEQRLNRLAAKMEYDKLMGPEERLTRQLRAFFERHDPRKIHLVEGLVREAVSRPDGMMRLNEKLLDKYDATISLDF